MKYVHQRPIERTKTIGRLQLGFETETILIAACHEAYRTL